MSVLVLDGYNLLHRARSGFQLGNFNVCYNFFRGLRPLVEQFNPTRIYFTLEGDPQWRYQLLPEYKANRLVDQTTEEGQAKHKSLEDFHRQKDLIVDLLVQYFPISVVFHPNHEGDDVVFNLIDTASRAIDFVVVSSDSDFTQLLQQFHNVKLYNPITKSYVKSPPYDYVLWKSLCGDTSDNIPGIPGVGDKRAAEACVNPTQFNQLLVEHGDMIKRNKLLIQFSRWTREEAVDMFSSAPDRDWDAVKQKFAEWDFKSMTKDSYWSNFVGTFNSLWGT